MRANKVGSLDGFVPSNVEVVQSPDRIGNWWDFVTRRLTPMIVVGEQQRFGLDVTVLREQTLSQRARYYLG